MANAKLTRVSFLNYTPVPLAFGTSGLRGLVTDITDLEAYINVKAALRYLASIGDIRTGAGVVIAGDLRPSTDRIMRACAQAIVDSGYQVENAGKIPTPALIFRSISTKRAGVMVSGSHIPFDRNGIKLNKSIGEVLKSDEAGISREIERVRAEEYSRTTPTSSFDANGMLKRAPELPPIDRAAEEAYMRRYIECFKRGVLDPMRVIVYQHSAVGRDILPRILSELGAEVVTVGRSDTFVPIDTENITDEELDRLEGFATASEKSGGRPIAAIVSTDGDSDRPLVTAVLPSAEFDSGARRVRFLPGDLLGIVVAAYLSADGVAVPISANDAVERCMVERQVALLKTKIGSPYVVAALDELHCDARYRRIVGWEANGGFLTGSDMALNNNTLEALPTRDSILPILANLYAAAEQRIGLSALWDRLPARFGRAGLLDDFPVAVSQKILAQLIPPGESVEIEYDGAGEVIDRSRAEVNGKPLPAPARVNWRQSKATLAGFFTAALGFDEIVRINVLDGVRIYFRNGDIAHIRPSGNAPQLRIYANSGSQARADQIVELGLGEPDGILRQLEKAFT
jgi:phosphomannomutase